uniref:Uncharacterized protein n=1 Tax=Salmonella phage vB_SEnST11_KE23 TaxID=3161174 RepID=A0AAU8GIP7_9CAUD
MVFQNHFLIIIRTLKEKMVFRRGVENALSL